MNDTAEPLVSRPRWRWLRRLAVGGFVCVIALVAIVHLPVVRGAILARVITSLQAQGIRLQADRLAYNLATLDVTLEGVTVAAEGIDPPFLTLDAVRVNLPWSIVSGTIHIESAEVTRPRVTIVRDATGALNLPDFGGDDDSRPFEGPVLIDRLLVSDLAVRYEDATNAQQFDLRGATLDMTAGATTPLAGTLTVREPATLQIGDRTTTISRLASSLTFNGVTIGLDPLEAEATEGRVRISGTVDAFGADPDLRLDYTVRADATGAAAWLPVTPAPTGTVVVDGTMSGDRTAPDVAFDITTDALAWSTLGPIDVGGRGTFAGTVVALDTLRVDVAGGTLTATGRVDVDDDGSSAVDARWTNLDLARLLAEVPAATVRPGAISDGSLTMDWTGTDVLGGRITATTRQRALGARQNLVPLAGRIDLASRARQWTLTGTPRVADAIDATVRATGRLADDLAQAPLAGTVDITVADLAAALTQLEATGLVPDLGDDTSTGGAVTVALTLGGTLAVPRAAGTIDGQALRVQGTGPATLAARVDASTRVVQIDDLRLELATNQVTGQATIGIEANTIAGVLEATLPDIAAAAAALPEAWRPDGAATVSATIGGALDNPTADLRIATSRPLEVAGQTIDAITSDVRVVNRVAIIDALTLTQQEGQLTASGQYAFDGGRYTFDANATGLVVNPIITADAVASPGAEAPGLRTPAAAQPTAAPPATIPVHTRIDLELTGSGTVDAPQASGQVRLADVAWGAYQIGAATADVAVADGQAHVTATVPSISGLVDATVALDSRRLTATATIDNAELAALARVTGPAGPVTDPDDADAEPATGDSASPRTIPLTGTIGLTAAVEGGLDDLASLDVTAGVTLRDATVNGLPVRATRPVRVRHTAGTVEAEDVELFIGDARLTARGRLGTDAPAGDGLAVELVGTLADFAPLARLAPGFEDATMAGNLELNLLASGPLDAPDVTAYLTVTDGEVGMADLPPASNVTLAATYTAGMVNVSAIGAHWQDADLLALGYLPLSLLGDAIPAAYRATLPPALGPARFDVRLYGLSPEALRPFLDADSVAQITGQVDLTADVEATAFDLDSVRAEVRLDRADVELARVPLAQTQPTRLRLANRRLDVVEWHWAGTGNEFSVRGHVQLDDAATTLDLGVMGSLDLRMISAFAPGMATRGRANLDVTATGDATDPELAGTVSLEETDIIVRDPRVAITDMTGTARLSHNRVTLEGLTANANGGTVSIIGDLDYSDFALEQGAITVTGRGLAIEAVDGLRTELNADLTVAMAKGEPTIGGRVTVVRGDYRQPLRLTEQLFSTLEMQTSGPGATDDGMMSRLQLDLTIVSAEDIVVDNNYGQLEVGTNLRVTGTPASPILGGRLALREGGEIFLGGQTYTLQRGTIDFTNATRIEPNFDIALETRVRNYDITLELSGTPDALEVGLRGPSITQQDAISLLLTGQLAEDSTTAYSEVARGQLLMLLSGELLSTAGRAVGLDSVQVSRGLGGAASTFDLLATDSDPEARLTLAKNLSRELELIMSQSLRNTGDITWIAVYRPVRRIELRAATDDASRETYEFRHEIQFGGAPGAAANGPTRRVDPRISGIFIEGAPGIPNSELMNQMRLGVGDRFDYFDWQRDRDRLAAFYQSRGFLEARIAPRREPSADGQQMALTYNIRQGPRTTLRVEGFTLSRATTAEIEDAWSQSVFDGFLEDDAERIVQRALVRARHLQGTVDASMSTDADGANKTLTIAIAPGPESTTRRIDFTGNKALSTSELRSAVDAQNGTVAVWLERDAIETTLAALYRSRGYLSADVTVSAPRFENGTAVLPVRIDEGPAYRLGTIGVSGAAFRTADAVRQVTGLQSGTPYLPGEVEPARRRVEVDYLGAGYNTVSVSTIVGIDEDRAVADVVFAVAEGPQQILQDVTVSGTRVTSDGTIDRALRLDMGKPLDMSDVYAAQKRLYDTSVFQRVDVEVEPIEGAEAAPGTQPVRAVVGLQEMPRFRFRYGFRISDSPGPAEESHQIRPGLVSDFLNRNLFGRAIAAGVAGQLESDRYLARGILSLPTPFRLPLTTNVFLTWSRQTIGEDADDITPYVKQARELTFEQRMRPARTMSVSWGYTYGRTHEYLLTPDPFTDFDEITYVARLTGTYAWDTRDDPSNATRGWFHSSGLEYAPGRLGSNLKFVRYLAQQYYFHTLGEHVTLASALRVGLGRGFGQDLPSTERFYTGGGTSVRGFAEEAIGGRDFFGFLIGGASLFQFNQEVRFPIFRWVRGVGFFDTGNIFPTIRDLSLTTLERGAGLGLRIQSPFAIIRVDYGIPLSNRQNERARWYFGIGQTF
ncbi:MAG: hypothetical protein ABS36_15600 [Acidobacteria bacterium SCN 69-37]|nr:MAG: hypothetical protein ABS36_15600 [Acidobacteria bacterium SCN 69-37]